MMLKRYSAFVLLSALLATAASARDDECKEAEEQHRSAEQQLQSARLGSSEAATEYSTCVEDQGPENCGDESFEIAICAGRFKNRHLRIQENPF